MLLRFNIRVYGLWINSGKVLVSFENYAGLKVTKFPGGGLIYGEGTKDCLTREWMEEMKLPIEVLEHFYTTDFFQPSIWEDTQVVSIYYKVQPQIELGLPKSNGEEVFQWLDIDEYLNQKLSLPIDKIVGQMLFEKRP